MPVFDGIADVGVCLCVDEDDDGYCDADDCDDGDAEVNPASLEVCDGLDNNCDGMTDEGCAGEEDVISAADTQQLDGAAADTIADADNELQEKTTGASSCSPSTIPFASPSATMLLLMLIMITILVPRLRG